MPETMLTEFSRALGEGEEKTYNASRPAPIEALCTMQVDPMLIGDARGSEEEHCGCRAIVKVMTIPQLSIHAVTETRSRWTAIFWASDLLVPCSAFASALPV